VSYSLYLTHVSVLLGLVYVLHSVVAVRGALGLALPATLLVAVTWWYLVEAPAQAYGYRLSAWLQQAVPMPRGPHSPAASGVRSPMVNVHRRDAGA
jgi:peptidoglycan/LPS O-acetylase OafA/YrhL